MLTIRRGPRLILALMLPVFLQVTGCAAERQWVAAPTLAVEAGAAMFDATPPANRTADIEVLYVTDRAVDDHRNGSVVYGFKRSSGMSFGVATVGFHPRMSWDELVAQSVNPDRRQKYCLQVDQVTQVGEVAPFSERMQIDGDHYVMRPDAAQALAQEDAQLAAMIKERLDRTSDKSVYLSVHGLENTFDDAIFRTAEVWHYGGRHGVALAYTWPAGHGGLLGYVYDRESAEFTVFHLKRVLRVVAQCPEVERVHIITHSRGAEVAISALRELHLQAQVSGEDTGKQLKLETLVFAAPDIDWHVFQQRFTAEGLMNVPRRTLIYFSKSDDALGFAEWLFNSVRRLGRMVVATDFGPVDVRQFAGFERVEYIDCDVSGYNSSHNYVFAHPAVLSDLILAVRDRLAAGDARRPLAKPVDGVWQIDNDYLKSAPAAAR